MNLFSGPLRGTGPLPDTTRAPYWSFGYSDLGDTALLAEEAVIREPVSWPRFPGIREKYREFAQIRPLSPLWGASCGHRTGHLWCEFPTRHNSVFLEPDQGEKSRHQGLRL